MAMRILIVGTGSIGRRHFRNLHELGVRELAVVRSRRRMDEPRREFFATYRPRVFYDLASALAEKPDAVFICNPTSLHAPTALAAIRGGAHVFIEKPISHSLLGVRTLIREAEKRERILFVGYHFRYHPHLIAIKRLLEKKSLGTVYAARFTTGEYLPNWHPWENYRKSYAARRDLGGGVTLTQSHDFDIALWLFGKPRSVMARVGASGLLDLDVDDTADMVFSLEQCPAVSIHLDYLARPPEKRLEIFGSQGRIEWDYHAGTLCIVSGNGKVRSVPLPQGFERNQMYLAEARDFIRCVRRTEEPESNGISGCAVLEMCLRAKEASRRKRIVAF